MPVNSARKQDSVEINAERRCQNSGPSICFTVSVKRTHRELSEETASCVHQIQNSSPLIVLSSFILLPTKFRI